MGLDAGTTTGGVCGPRVTDVGTTTNGVYGPLGINARTETGGFRGLLGTDVGTTTVGVGGPIDTNAGTAMGRVCSFSVGGELDVIIDALGFSDFVCNVLKKVALKMKIKCHAMQKRKFKLSKDIYICYLAWGGGHKHDYTN